MLLKGGSEAYLVKLAVCGKQLMTMMAIKMVFSSVGSEGNLAFDGGGTS